MPGSSIQVKTLCRSINKDAPSAHLRSLRMSGTPMCPCRQLVSLRGFSLNGERHRPPLPPNLPISPCARYGESDDDVLEQLLQGRRRQDTGSEPSAKLLAERYLEIYPRACPQVHEILSRTHTFGNYILHNCSKAENQIMSHWSDILALKHQL